MNIEDFTSTKHNGSTIVMFPEEIAKTRLEGLRYKYRK